MGLDIKWSYLYNEEDKIAAEWFLSNAISCLGSAEGAMYEIPEHVKPVLRKPQLFTVIPRIYCEQCGSYEIPYCAECGKPMECDEMAGYTVLVVPHSTYNVLKGIVLVEWKTGTFLQAGCIL